MDNYFNELLTESVNTKTINIDELSTIEMVTLINQEDKLVACAVEKELPNIEKAVDIIYNCLKHNGRLIYIGAGTSGRLGVLDASECPPTFGTDPELVKGFIAGGDIALRRAVENSEDDFDGGSKLILENNFTNNDVIVGITCSGGAPFVLGAIEMANAIGAKTIGIVNNKNTKLEKITSVCISPVVGPEVITGSTRLKSGTAEKMVLNMLSTCVMIKLGKVYGNLMVDLQATNKKLFGRSIRIIRYATKVDEQTAKKVLEDAKGSAKVAIFMIKADVNYEKALRLLNENEGSIKRALKNL